MEKRANDTRWAKNLIAFRAEIMRSGVRESWLKIFFGIAAVSWTPHWSCHYYRLETASSFAVGTWDFSRFDSAIALLIYSALIAANLTAIGWLPLRASVALSSGVLHLLIGGLHAYRLISPFRFEVFGYAWSQRASLREAIIVIPFGVFCLWVAKRK